MKIKQFDICMHNNEQDNYKKSHLVHHNLEILAKIKEHCYW